jgi:hypothetical protein
MHAQTQVWYDDILRTIQAYADQRGMSSDAADALHEAFVREPDLPTRPPSHAVTSARHRLEDMRRKQRTGTLEYDPPARDDRGDARPIALRVVRWYREHCEREGREARFVVIARSRTTAKEWGLAEVVGLKPMTDAELAAILGRSPRWVRGERKAAREEIVAYAMTLID